ncbi:ATP-binding protein [Streptomyces megasporus]|uniref:ATP-binding protein n=1 Tax=Streptomyces megasporus TaxID=44060 RepID=UPI0004E0DDBB|nr:ATP-binding protein [Streptomyces megasporus]
MTQHIPEAVFWCLATAAPAAVLLVRQSRISARLRRRLTSSEAALRSREEEVRHLVEVRLAALVETPHGAASVPGPLDAELATTAYGANLEKVVEMFANAAAAARSRADQSAKTALKGAVRALQALANEQQLSISDMQDRHDNPDVLRDLLEIDHANAQFGRRAQAIAVLCGSWPGRQRDASPLIDVVRGATSRIRDYRRVKVHSQMETAVVSRAVEPVVLAVAELLDNAARHSQPNTTVEVGIRPAHNGASIIIDDAGVGMDTHEVEEATRRLSGREDIDINRLGDPPQFGFAVIGVLAARYGFSVSVDTQSPYGGVRAVLFLPNTLLERKAPVEPAAARRTEAPAFPSGTASAGEAAGEPAAPTAPALSLPTARTSPAEAAVRESTAGGLPKRRRREPRPLTPADGATPTDSGPALVRPATETASRMSAFARGTRSGRGASQDSEGNPQE